jgi:hypothetical protein
MLMMAEMVAAQFAAGNELSRRPTTNQVTSLNGGMGGIPGSFWRLSR